MEAGRCQRWIQDDSDRHRWCRLPDLHVTQYAYLLHLIQDESDRRDARRYFMGDSGLRGAH